MHTIKSNIQSNKRHEKFKSNRVSSLSKNFSRAKEDLTISIQKENDQQQFIGDEDNQKKDDLEKLRLDALEKRKQELLE